MLQRAQLRAPDLSSTQFSGRATSHSGRSPKPLDLVSGFGEGAVVSILELWNELYTRCLVN